MSEQREWAVKPLEWVQTPVGYWKANSVSGRYSIFRVSQAIGFDLRRDGEGLGRYHPSVEEAKAAAQADYEQRIRSALVPPAASAEAGAASTIAVLEGEVARLRGALIDIAYTCTEDSHGNTKDYDVGYYKQAARAALSDTAKGGA